MSARWAGYAFFVLGIATASKPCPSHRAVLRSRSIISLLIPAMLLTLGIALASLLSSYYFSKFAKVWDRRLHEIDESECALKKTLGLDEA